MEDFFPKKKYIIHWCLASLIMASVYHLFRNQNPVKLESGCVCIQEYLKAIVKLTWWENWIES
jgi:hypothetical protein